MSKKKAHAGSALREQIAAEAARIMVESGNPSYLVAKKKAAQRLGAADGHGLPNNEEIERAIVEYQRLFLADTQPGHLRRLREAGLQAMRLLEPFGPRLVGPVLEGTADHYSEVNLHVFADTVEDVGLYLMNHDIPADLSTRRLREPGGANVEQPEYRFVAGDIPVGVTVFSGPSGRQPPVSPVDGRPMRRASMKQVEALLAEPGDAGLLD